MWLRAFRATPRPRVCVPATTVRPTLRAVVRAQPIMTATPLLQRPAIRCIRAFSTATAASAPAATAAAARVDHTAARAAFLSSLPESERARLSSIRNIGVIAHIDAGKTTTTERFLYYANRIHHLGDVDAGDTTTDFEREERRRGITIKAACVTLPWRVHRINVIDTPGHVDFTVEVERALRVLDGTIGVFDAVKGVQAQSETVWKQAMRYDVPCLAFLNKMDRPGASVRRSVASLRSRLNVKHPILLQLPIWTGGVDPDAATSGDDDSTAAVAGSNSADVPEFVGVIDLVSMSTLRWDTLAHPAGDVIDKRYFQPFAQFAAQENAAAATPIRPADVKSKAAAAAASSETIALEPASSAAALYARALAERQRLIVATAEVDDELMELYLNAAEPDSLSQRLPPAVLRAAVRRAVIGTGNSSGTKAVGILCGAAFKNRGVQPLMDAVVDYLPSPIDKPPVHARIVSPNSPTPPLLPGTAPLTAADRASTTYRFPDPNAPLCALAFKVKHLDHAAATASASADAGGGGTPSSNATVYMRVYSGTLRTRDTVLNTSHFPLQSEKVQRLLHVQADVTKDVDRIEAGNIGAVIGLKLTRTGDTLVAGNAAGADATAAPVAGGLISLAGISVPEPVFFCSVETDTSSQQVALDEALACVCREDPSVQVEVDPDTTQTLIKGMGELHLEIIRNRLQHEFKVDCRMGAMRVSYRESIESPLVQPNCLVFSGPSAGGRHSVAGVSLLVEAGPYGSGNRFDIAHTVKLHASAKANPKHRIRRLAPDLVDALREAEAAAVPARKPSAAATATAAAAASSAGGVRSGPPIIPPCSVTFQVSEELEKVAREPDTPLIDDFAMAIRESAYATLTRGVVLGYPLVDVHVTLLGVRLFNSTSISSLKQATHHAIRDTLKRSAPVLMEPVMTTDIELGTPYVGDVVTDLTSKRRAHIRHVNAAVANANAGGASASDEESEVHSTGLITAEVPLREMIGYSTALRSRTAGTGRFSMQFHSYRAVSPFVQQQLIKEDQL